MIKINDKEYKIEKLSEEAKAQITNIKYVDTKIADLKAQLATLNAARAFYSDQLQKLLPKK